MIPGKPQSYPEHPEVDGEHSLLHLEAKELIQGSVKSGMPLAMSVVTD
jgi:hypothetical protein